MKPELLTPRGGYKPDVVFDAIGLAVEDGPDLAIVETWTRFELALAYDWAIREHLAAAGNRTRRRPRPQFTRRREAGR